MYDMVGIKFMIKVGVIEEARSSINKITLIAADISKAMSDMAMVAGPNGLIRSATVTKDGTIVYGEWVDCTASANTLANCCIAYSSPSIYFNVIMNHYDWILLFSFKQIIL